ncbi:MAG: hypothetical protein ACRERR_10020 [Moraxellaceae bacterium]
MRGGYYALEFSTDIPECLPCGQALSPPKEALALAISGLCTDILAALPQEVRGEYLAAFRRARQLRGQGRKAN